MADIVISEFMDESVVEDGFGSYSVLYDPQLVDQPDRLASELAQAKALVVRNRTQVNQALLEQAPNLCVVGRLGVGLDNIDQLACAEHNVAVCPATGANDQSVAEWVITAALMLLRRAWLGTAQVANGEWPRTQMMGREIAGKRLGLVGFGGIAKQTASRAQALGMTVCAYDPFVEDSDPAWQANKVAPVGLQDLLRTADVVSLHVPLTADTRNLIGAAALGLMKDDAILVNAARGGVVDESALVEALSQGKVGGAALDVYEAEPLSADNGARFQGLDNVILTPHIAGVTDESNERVSALTATNVLRELNARSD